MGPQSTAKAQRLQELELLNTELKVCSLAVLPVSTRRLRIKNCQLFDACLIPLPQSVVVQQRLALPVTELDLSGRKISKAGVRRILLVCPHVKVLKLNDCFDTYESIRCVHDVLSSGGPHQLEVLEAAATSVQYALSPLGSHYRHVCRHLKDTLRRLSVAGSPIDVLCAETITEQLTNLETLDVSHCRGLSNSSFLMFANLRPTLRCLGVLSTNASRQTVTMLRSIMPDCKIVN